MAPLAKGRPDRSAEFTPHEADARDRFDAWSEGLMFAHLRSWLSYLQGQVLGRIDWAESERVLDVACGSGLAVYEAGRRLTGQGVAVGCDISFGMLGQRSAAGADIANAHFLAASAQALPYADNSFDAAICTAAFHHFPDPAEALRELRRVLRPGGQLLIADPCRNQSVGNWVWDRLHRWFEKSHVMYYRTDELSSLLDAAGYGEVELTALHPAYSESRKLIRHGAIVSGRVPR